jgi:DNA repair photolyase
MHQKLVKSVLNKHKKRDDWFLDEYSVNPYEGCSGNCLYCYVRGSKYGENMDEGLAVKINVLEILEKQLRLRALKRQYGFVAVGSATDAYLPHEEKYGLTRGILQLMLKYRFPVFISTRQTLITRDIDILKEISRAAILPPDLQNRLPGVILAVSVSSLSQTVTNMLEPGCALPLERLNTIQHLRSQGFLAGVNAIPLLPFISDTDEQLEEIISASKSHSASFILTGSLTLFGNGVADSKVLYYKFLQRYNASLVPAYDKLYGNNFYVPWYYQQALKQKAALLCSKYNIKNSIL